jgi:dienelactone hydrolase
MCHSEVPEGQPEMVVAWQDVGIPVGGVDMPALVTPGADGLPSVLVIADMFGPTPFYEHLSALLTAAGFRTLLPDYFFREGPVDEGDLQGAFARRRRLDENRTLEDMRRAISWLRGTDGESKVGVLGFCMGGTFATWRRLSRTCRWCPTTDSRHRSQDSSCRRRRRSTWLTH